ncbi:MAG: gamma-glutamylcyclotransferase [Bacteriovoracaceae bacterium]|nr:gamma-glutamylcyclotransferase [Bacteriovoracaceae bacterium]
MRLFSYGTLQDHDVLKIVASTEKFNILGAGTLQGFKALYVENEEYPILSPCKDSLIPGTIIDSISEEFWKRVDFFEQNYEKIEKEIATENSSLNCFVFSEEFGKTTIGREWDFVEWQSLYKVPYLERSKKFMGLYDKGLSGVW